MRKTPARILLLIVALALFIVPVVALAAAGFDDVDNDNVFVADIQWMKDNGITKGCNPPTNNKFCPSQTVTREQMSAFMHRLAVSKVVNAATAVEADKLDGKDATAFLGKTEKAADSDKLDGKDSTALMSIAASAVTDGFEVSDGVTPPASSIVTSLTGFNAPTGGGVITATATSTYSIGAAQFGALWIVVDGTCADDFPEGGVGIYLTDAPFGEVSASFAAPVSSGNHSIDVCTTAVGTVPTSMVSTRLNVVWSPVASSAGVASSSATTSIDDMFARYAGALENFNG